MKFTLFIVVILLFCYIRDKFNMILSEIESVDTKIEHLNLRNNRNYDVLEREIETLKELVGEDNGK